MGKAGEKQKRRPKITDKKESERFIATVREIGADESPENFERVFAKLVPPKKKPDEARRLGRPSACGEISI